MHHTRFRFTADDVMPKVIERLKSVEELAPYITPEAIAAVLGDGYIARIVRTLDQAVYQSADGIKTLGRIDHTHDRINKDVIAEARRLLAPLILARDVAREMINLAEEQFNLAFKEGQASLEAERAGRFEPAAHAAQGAIVPEGPGDPLIEGQSPHQKPPGEPEDPSWDIPGLAPKTKASSN